MKPLVLTILFIAPMSACASGPTAEELAAADYGESPGDAGRGLIRLALERWLRDPYSAEIRTGQPHKAWWRESGFSPVEFGWRIYAEVNAKNAFGAYTGVQTYAFYFKHGRVSFVQGPPGTY